MKRKMFTLLSILALCLCTVFGITACGTTAVTQVALNKTELSLTVGAEETLTATVSPDDATDKSVTWSSSDESIATVSAAGKVTAVAVGSATVTVKTTDGSKEATCAVTVTEATPGTVAVTGVTLDKTSATLIDDVRGGVLTLNATVAPADATDKAVTWTSSDPTVAAVVDGVVTAKKAGTATITVTTVDGSKTATCTITVNAVTSRMLLTVGQTVNVEVDAVDISDTTVVSYAEGVFTTLKEGEVILTVKDADEEVVATAIVIVCTHADEDADNTCDKCGLTIECVICVDANEDNQCDNCWGCIVCYDGNHDQTCDMCGDPVACPHTPETTNFDNLCDWCNVALPENMKHVHSDADNNCVCDVCTDPIAHVDVNRDCDCDVCGYQYEHVDANDDCICDVCDYNYEHVDTADGGDCECDICGSAIAHKDADSDCECDVCTTAIPHVDADTDCECDVCGYQYDHVDEDDNCECDVCGYQYDHVDEDDNCECDICTDPLTHVDADNNCVCDVCTGDIDHVDADNNCVCDKENCQEAIPHVDENTDCVCDKENCQEAIPHVDANSDCECDVCGHLYDHVDANNDCVCDVCTGDIAHVDADTDCECDVCTDPIPHVDENTDCACDVCTTAIPHVDADTDCKCDVCTTAIPHVDENTDCKCDVCTTAIPHVDADNNCVCDVCTGDIDHVDEDNDCVCDKENCQEAIPHVDEDNNCVCDKESCQESLTHVDEDNDCVCDKENCQEDIPHVGYLGDGVCDTCTQTIITLNITNNTLVVNEDGTLQLEYAFNEAPTVSTVTFTAEADKEAVATVTSAGLVTYVGAGTIEVTVTWTENENVKCTKTLTMQPDDTKLRSVSGVAVASSGSSGDWFVPVGTELIFTKSGTDVTKTATVAEGGAYTAQLTDGTWTAKIKDGDTSATSITVYGAALTNKAVEINYQVVATGATDGMLGANDLTVKSLGTNFIATVLYKATSSLTVSTTAEFAGPGLGISGATYTTSEGAARPYLQLGMFDEIYYKKGMLATRPTDGGWQGTAAKRPWDSYEIGIKADEFISGTGVELKIVVYNNTMAYYVRVEGGSWFAAGDYAQALDGGTVDGFRITRTGASQGKIYVADYSYTPIVSTEVGEELTATVKATGGASGEWNLPEGTTVYVDNGYGLSAQTIGADGALSMKLADGTYKVYQPDYNGYATVTVADGAVTDTATTLNYRIWRTAVATDTTFTLAARNKMLWPAINLAQHTNYVLEFTIKADSSANSLAEANGGLGFKFTGLGFTYTEKEQQKTVSDAQLQFGQIDIKLYSANDTPYATTDKNYNPNGSIQARFINQWKGVNPTASSGSWTIENYKSEGARFRVVVTNGTHQLWAYNAKTQTWVTNANAVLSDTADQCTGTSVRSIVITAWTTEKATNSINQMNKNYLTDMKVVVGGTTMVEPNA